MHYSKFWYLGRPGHTNFADHQNHDMGFVGAKPSEVRFITLWVRKAIVFRGINEVLLRPSLLLIVFITFLTIWGWGALEHDNFWKGALEEKRLRTTERERESSFIRQPLNIVTDVVQRYAHQCIDFSVMSWSTTSTVTKWNESGMVKKNK